ncbi:MAG: assimilatory sulfite reductase (NADPH) flavoprotein subunit [Methylococcales bacterium]
MPILLPGAEQTPLNAEQHRTAQQLIVGLSPEQLAWFAGYMTAQIVNNSTLPVNDLTIAEKHDAQITILVGSQTGNSSALALQIQTLANKRSLNAVIQHMEDYPLTQLKSAQFVLVIVSTYGEGEPPDNAKELYEQLLSKRAPSLNQTHFAVLALGDSSYEFFCKTGADFDQRLAELGATRILPRVDCDVDYEASAEAWMEDVLNALSSRLGAGAQQSAISAVPVFKTTASSYSRKNPFSAPLLEKIILNGRGSIKETYHIELSLENSGLSYAPGDALGVYPSNAPKLVDALLQALHFSSAEAVVIDAKQRAIGDALLHHYEITTITRPMLQKYATLAKLEALHQLLDDGHKEAFNVYCYGRDIIDLVTDFSVRHISPQAFVDCLRKQSPRLYSIASSLKRHPDEVHLTVAAVRYETYGRRRKGVASTFLADSVDENHPVPVYIHHNNNFKLPNDPAAPIIMIGSGTSIAPFRAFIEEREAMGATGKNWLFFGDQHFTTDFLYQTEWQRYLKKGVLTRMDVAFSRDQEQKIYVQQRMQERAKELYAWLENGATVYVCGDEKRMAQDVHTALQTIVAAESGNKDSAAYLTLLQKQKRYQRDVY